MHPTHATLLLQLVAFWPVWRWYLARLSDASDEPLGIIALATAGLVLLRHGRPQRLTARQVLMATGLCGLYLSVWMWSTPLVRGSLAVIALAYTLGAGYLRHALHPGWLGLLWLSLPLTASLQFYTGYPLRVATAWLAAHLLSLSGVSVTAQGTCLLWHGEIIAVDAPCAGIRMLWVGMYLSCTMSCITRLRPRLAGWGMLATMVVLCLGNVARNVLLFYGEAGIVPFTPWMHTGIGLGVFSGTALVIVALHRFLQHRPVCSEGALRHPSPAGVASARLALGGYLLVHGLAAIFPLLPTAGAGVLHRHMPPQWPTQFAGRPLYPLPFTAQEQALAQGFPGQIARFTDGSREIVLRWVPQATRTLHPASDCFRGLGYAVQPQPLHRDGEGVAWGCVQATRGAKRWQVCERVSDNQGQSWSDVSAWYWAALLGQSSGPWWGFIVAEEVSP